MVYLDNAATTFHKPATVYEAVNNAIKELSANPGRSGHELSMKTSEMVYNTREKTAEYFNAESYENIVFTQNCTMAINLCMRGLFKKDDHIIISDLEHNSVFRTAFDLKKNGVEVDIFESNNDEEITIKNIYSLIKPNTKGVVCTNGSNVFGIKLPIREIGKLCKSKNLLFIVDAAQTAGVIKIDMKADNIDYLCIAPHKGLYTPMGLGVLITDTKPSPIITGGTGSSSGIVEQPNFLPDKYESGTINVPAISGLSAGIDFVKSNERFIYQKEMNIINYIYTELCKMKKIKLYNKPDLPVLSFNINNDSSENIASYLNKNNICVRAGLHCAPLAHKKFKTEDRGTVRISASYFNTMNEAKYFVKAVDKY